MLERIFALMIVVAVALTAGYSASAQELSVSDVGVDAPAYGEPPPPDPALDDEELDHFELTMGFTAGARRYGDESFAYSGGADGMDGAGALVEPFEKAPFDSMMAFGLRYDLRLVVSHVRMTVGVDFPFAHFQTKDTRSTYTVGGIEREVVVQKVRPYELRFGIGGEYTFGKVTPFVDLVGEVDWVTAGLAVDGNSVEYRANSFGFSVRAGVRVSLREWFFISIAGDVGVVGNRLWDGELSLGFAFG